MKQNETYILYIMKINEKHQLHFVSFHYICLFISPINIEKKASHQNSLNEETSRHTQKIGKGKTS